MSVKQKKYTHKVKLSTLRILEKNDYNYLKTEKHTGVSRSTIKKWEAAYGVEVFSGASPTEVALQEVDLEMKRNDEVIIRKYYTLRNEILDRIAELIPNEQRLDPLVGTLKSITEEIKMFDEMAQKNAQPSGQNILQTIITQIQDRSRDISLGSGGDLTENG
jgi:transcriptional regulator with XRE-family HTH domain